MSRNPEPYRPYASPSYASTVWESSEAERGAFIRSTYAHLAGAVAGFIAIQAAIFTFVPDETLAGIVSTMFGGRWSWLIVLGAFMGVSWLAESWAQTATSRSTQYAGLALYVVAEAVIFLPLLYVASLLDERMNGETAIIPTAGLLTGIVFAGLTFFVFVTKANLSWLGKYLFWAALLGFGVILCGLLFGFSFGLWVVGAFIALASGYILYHTSNVLHAYRTDQDVAAALALFASVALLFWYMLQLVMAFSRSDD